jgi:hypothetical protein
MEMDLREPNVIIQVDAQVVDEYESDTGLLSGKYFMVFPKDSATCVTRS